MKALPEGEYAALAVQTGRAAIEHNSMRYLKSRIEIEEEIRLRLERWKQRVKEEPPPVQRELKRGAVEHSGTVAKEIDEPPPPTQSSAEGESDEPPAVHG